MGGVYIDAQTERPGGIKCIFRPPEDWDPPIPFEGNYGTVYEEAPEYIGESFYESSEADGYYLLIDDIPNEEGQLAVLGCPDGSKHYHYSDKPYKDCQDDFAQFGTAIGQKLLDLSQSGIHIDQRVGRASIKPVVYDLEDGWVIDFPGEIVYGEHPTHVGVIAATRERAEYILKALFERLRETPLSRLSRRELFHDIQIKDEYNRSEEANKLRYKYMKKIKHAYEVADFSDLYEDLDEECRWDGGYRKDGVIEHLSGFAEYMREKNLRRRCVIVQVGRPVAPIECNTRPDGTGETVMLSLLYHQGEICMVEETPRGIDFCRMTISPNGKIKEYYVTLPSGDWHVIG